MLEELSQTDYASWVRESLWGWPMSLTVHAFGNAAVIGLSFIIALRLLGFFRTIPYTSLNRLFPVIWVSVVFQVLSGTSLWMTKPDKYINAGLFDAKFSFVLVAVLVTAIFQIQLKGCADSWQASGKVMPYGLNLVVAGAGLIVAFIFAAFAVYTGLIYLAVGWGLGQSMLAAGALTTVSVAVAYALMQRNHFSKTERGQVLLTACAPAMAVLWAGVLMTGRLTAYLGQLYGVG
jgi:hypothetical protein